MRVFHLSTLDELGAYADDWDRLAAGVPFRSWAWQSTWWRHYQGPNARLAVLGVFDDADAMVGLAPWYVVVSATAARVLRLLGSGEVCSDHLGVLCQPGKEFLVTATLADYLTGDYRTGDGRAGEEDPLRWDLLELTGCDADDSATAHLIQHLSQRDATVQRRAGPNCWRIELPTTWDEYLAGLSRGHRKQIRRLQRNLFDTGRAVLRSVRRVDELPAAMDLLVDLHRRRREMFGQPGCFASPRFQGFHRDVARRLLRGGQLQLSYLELDGRPAAAEYQLVGDGVVYAYQSGIAPDVLDRQPGRLITLAALRRAIERGYRAYDFLRGDEPYKSHFRAAPRPGVEARIVPRRTTARLRHGLRLAGGNVERWIKSGLRTIAGASSAVPRAATKN